MEMLDAWTGRTACALQEAFRLSNELFARKLDVSGRTVAAWHQKPELHPKSGIQQVLDATLEKAPPAVRARFAQLTSTSAPRTDSADATGTTQDGAVAAADQRLGTDPNLGAAIGWLDEHAGWTPGTARSRVLSRLAQFNVHEWRDWAGRWARVGRESIANALGAYYQHRPADFGLYQSRTDGVTDATTSILTCADWLDLDCPFPQNDRLVLTSTSQNTDLVLDERTADVAVLRLAATLAFDGRLVNLPLYRLLSTDIRPGLVAGSVGLAPFVQYALTMDLLETELTSAIAAGGSTMPGSLPLRDTYLPDVASVLDLPGRLCAGGTLALCAIARPADPHRGPADYLLLVQERSAQVVNAAHRLAGIPKGFHQPLTDYGRDTQLGATLRREMEEELFGRDDLDNTVGTQRRADPMHPSRLSEPMRWLLDDPSRLRMECTGFGLNLVSGNYEFPGLVVIEDEEFWSRFGGHVEANWESAGFRQYSSLDRQILTDLIGDVGWSNEGLFALLQGFRRLSQVGGARVNAPTIEWELV
jgi:hypothetical protein